MEHRLAKWRIWKNKVKRTDEQCNVEIGKSRKSKKLGNADIAEVANTDLTCDANVYRKSDNSAQDIDDSAAASGEKWLLACSLNNGYVFGHGLF